MNQLAVTGVIPLEHATKADVLFAGALASQEANQDPIDLAFLAAAIAHRVFDGVAAVTPVSFAPFDAKSRRTEAVVEQNGQQLRVMKGAVRTVAQACGLKPPAIEALEARISESALKGYWTLAVARGPETGTPALLGLVTLYDPPRPDAKQLIATLYELGVPVKMLTGDALAVASEIARGVGLPDIRRVADLKAAGAQAGNEAVDLLAGADGFAEVYPEDKYIVVQRSGGGARDRHDGRRRQRCARVAPGRGGHRRQHRDRRCQGCRERRPDRTGADKHRGVGRACPTCSQGMERRRSKTRSIPRRRAGARLSMAL